jgi:hypothetical protein
MLLLTDIPETAGLVDFVKEISGNIPTLFVFTDDDLDPRLSRVQEEFLNEMMQWVIIKLSGTQLMLGPLFKTPSSPNACYDCLSLQLWRNQPVRKWGTEYKSGPMTIPVVFSVDHFLITENFLWIH